MGLILNFLGQNKLHFRAQEGCGGNLLPILQVRHQRESVPPENHLRGGRVARAPLQRTPREGLRDNLPVSEDYFGFPATLGCLEQSFDEFYFGVSARHPNAMKFLPGHVVTKFITN